MKNKIIALAIMAAVVLIPFKKAYMEDNTAEPIYGLFAFLATLIGVFVSMFIFERGKSPN